MNNLIDKLKLDCYERNESFQFAPVIPAFSRTNFGSRNDVTFLGGTSKVCKTENSRLNKNDFLRFPKISNNKMHLNQKTPVKGVKAQVSG